MNIVRRTGLGIVAVVVSLSSSHANAAALDTDALFVFFDQQLTKVAQTQSPFQPTHNSHWTAGFQPGMFWLMVQRDQAAYGTTYRPLAETWTTKLIGSTPTQVVNDSTFDTYLAGHTLQPAAPDVGFVYYNSFALGAELVGDASKAQAYRNVALKAANYQSTWWNDDYDAIRSFHNWLPNRDGPDGQPLDAWEDAVIIDHMMNLQLQHWGASHGGSATLAQQAVTHGMTTIEHLVRPDGSSFHVIDFHTDPTRDDLDNNPSTPEKYNLANPFKGTYQGYWHDSTWSRGQAWGIHGFTSATAAMDPGPERDAHLDAAQRMADYFIDNLPADHLPLWDFDALSGGPTDFDTTGLDLAQKDTSAAAIAASGLLDLALLVTDPDDKLRYFNEAEAILLALSQSPYLNLTASATDGSILTHVIGGFPQGDINNSKTYADFYFMQAVLKYDHVSAAVPEPAAAIALLLLSVVTMHRRSRTSC